MDLQDREHNTKDGLHIASLAGAWVALVGGFGGMRRLNGVLSFRPQVPPGIVGLSFRLRYRGRMLHVAIRSGMAEYCLLSGPPLEIAHYDVPVTVGPQAVTREIPQVPLPPTPSQPAGRTPQSRRARVLPIQNGYSPCRTPAFAVAPCSFQVAPAAGGFSGPSPPGSLKHGAPTFQALYPQLCPGFNLYPQPDNLIRSPVPC